MGYYVLNGWASLDNFFHGLMAQVLHQLVPTGY